MKVTFLPLNIDGSGCYRAIFPAGYLSERGHTAGIPAFMLRDTLGRQVPPLGPGGLAAVPPGDFDVFFIEETVPRDSDMYVFHLGSMRWQHDWAEKLDGAMVVDMDDDLHRVPAYNPGKLDPATSPDNNRRLAQQLIERADLVTCATPELARFYGRWNTNTVVLPNYLHWPMWEPVTPAYEQEWRRFRVGYMGNLDYHSADLQTIAPTLRKWLIRHPDVEFVAAGDPRIHELVGVPHRQRVSMSKVWFRNLDLPYITATMDVGLVPLARNAFNESKSCLKGMEYNACGIPCLATPTEEYQRWVVDGQNGFLCRHPRDLAARLDELLADRELTGRMGRAARHAAREAALDRHIEERENMYAGLCDHPDRVRQRTAA